jgi:hypothetical protein
MRNYKKEVEWRKNRYTEIKANIDKKLGENLKEKIKKENKTISGWIAEKAREYLNTEN